MNLISLFPITDCHECGTKNSLVIETMNGKKIHMSELISNQEILERTIFTKIECSYCGKVFELDWSNSEARPQPLLPYKLKNFFK